MAGQRFFRGFFYVLGLAVLALGIILNTKTGLGVSPIISVPFSISNIWGIDLGNAVLAVYIVFVLWEMFLHFSMEGIHGPHLCSLLLKDLLQLPLSLIFTRFMNLFWDVVPEFSGTSPSQMLLRSGVLLAGIVCTGIGVAVSLDMRLVPNPGDGIVQALADASGKKMGLVKNLFDLGSVLLTIFLCFLFTEDFSIIGIGAGTLAAVLGVGRVAALFQYGCGNSLKRAAGL